MGGTERGLRRLSRTALVARLIALLLAGGMLWPLGSIGRLGQGLALVPAVFAGVLVAATLIAELISWRDARGRSAALEVRRLRNYLSAPMTVAAVATTLVLVAAAAWTTAVAGPDDLGRAGRRFSYRCVDPSQCDSGSFGPFPGSFYTGPMLTGVVLLILLATVGLRVAVRRPRNGADPVVRQIDEQVRRSSIRTIVAAVVLGVAGSLVGLAGFGSNGFLANWSEVAPGLRVAGVLLQVAAVVGLILVIWSAIVVLAPVIDRPRLTRPARFAPVGTGTPR